MDIRKLEALPTYDVVIVGSGIAGALVAWKLIQLRKNARVLILEAGGMPPEWMGRRLLVQNFATSSSKGQDSPFIEEVNTRYFRSSPSVNAPQPLDEGVPPYYIDGNEATPFKSYYERLVGGALWHWQGIVMRMLPNDFRLKSHWKVDQARDWPIGYADLAGFYREAELQMGVSANVQVEEEMDTYFKVPPHLGKRGYAPQLQNGIPASFMDKYLHAKLEKTVYVEKLQDGTIHKIPLLVRQLSQARNAERYDGRPAC